MRSAELTVGRVFVLRLETGELLHEEIESFCRTHDVVRAKVSIVGGAGPGSKIVVGPKLPIVEGRVTPLIHEFTEPHEITGTGTVFPDEEGNPIMHMHGSLGREGRSVTGCFRAGVIVWLVLEVVIEEIVGDGPIRKGDPLTGFKILEIE